MQATAVEVLPAAPIATTSLMTSVLFPCQNLDFSSVADPSRIQ